MHMEEKMSKKGEGLVCRCPHHKFVPGLVVLFGLLFLLANFGVFSAEFVNVAWPILVLAAGLAKLSGSYCKCCC